MTPKQASVLQAIRDLTVGHVPPSYPEIMARAGINSRSVVHGLVYELVRLGHITMEPGKRRSIKVVDMGPPREDMERWSDAEVRRVTLDLYEIGRARGLGRRVAA